MTPERDNEDLRAHARTDDPDTSHQAAASVKKLRSKQQAVWEVLNRIGPAPDVGIVASYANASRVNPEKYPTQSVSGIRTRRSELVGMGLARYAGFKVKLQTGRQAQVWEAV